MASTCAQDDGHRRQGGSRARRLCWLSLPALALSACGDAPPPLPLREGAGDLAHAAVARASEQRAAWGWAGADEDPSDRDEPRGFGAMTARVPGTEQVISGVRLVSHDVSAVVRDGLARTTVEEVFQNDTGRVLEGRYVFPLPPDASISRLALQVGEQLVEGELLERPRAARIFKGIVDDTVRPRDPALLEWVSASEFSLKVFPIPPKGQRKVVLAYDQALEQAGGRVRYVVPLSLGADRAARVERFSITVSAADAGARLSGVETPGYAASIRADEQSALASYQSAAFAPTADFVVSYTKTARAEDVEDAVWASTFAPEPRAPAAPGARADARRASGFVAFRVRAELPEGAPAPSRARRDRAIVIDASHSQSSETFEAEARLAATLARALSPDERFVLLACDSDCATYPEDGLAPATGGHLDAAEAWLKQRTPGGSSDVGGAVVAAAKRLDPDGAGQIVYIGDGAASSGELSADTIAARVLPELRKSAAELRLLGLGRTLDETVFSGLAHAVGATYERVATGATLRRRYLEIAAGLRAPVLRDPTLVLPPGLHDVVPARLPNLRLGQETLVTARLTRGARPAAGADGALSSDTLTLSGTIGGAPYTLAKPIRWAPEAERNPMVPRLWARAKIAELEGSGDADAAKEAIRLSKEHHVMARGTALLVLESERMFAEFGIPRTVVPAVPLDANAPWGRSDASDVDAAVGHLFGDAAGAAGLGLSGVGEGGGGRGEGIGLGQVGALGHGAGSGFGGGFGRLGGSHRTSAPRVRSSSATVSGRLPPEVIQRVVRQQFGRMRHCYEQGLARNPALAGRVAVRFVIGDDGVVRTAIQGGSDLPDEAVVACVVRAFQGLSFPVPEGGLVTVVYPVFFSPGDGDATATAPAKREPEVRRSSTEALPVWRGPSVTHRAGSETAPRANDAGLDKLRAAVAASGAGRKSHAALVRGLLIAGRVDEALAAALRFAELDPDLDTAREQLAFAAAASGDAGRALGAVDTLTETSPRSVSRHERAARAFEAAGDERRACAHWRSLAELMRLDGERRAASGVDSAQVESLRCRARVLGERDAALGEARAMRSRGAGFGQRTALIAALEAGATPAFEPAAASGQFEVKVTCAAEGPACPTVAVVTPNGAVISPWTASMGRMGRASGRTVAFSGLWNGAYRTLASSASPGAGGRAEIEIRALGVTRKFSFEGTGTRPVAITTVSGIELEQAAL